MNIDRQICQGEDFVIFFTVFPPEDKPVIDKIWAETDEQIESSNVILLPDYSATLQLLFDNQTTMRFSTGPHVVRVWAESMEKKYVLIELTVLVNPAFPITDREEFRNYIPKDKQYKSSSLKVLSQQKAKVYPFYRAQLSYPFNMASVVKIHVVESESGKPIRADIGDLCLVSPEGDTTDPDAYLYICVKESTPCVWRRITNRIFEGGEAGLVPDSYIEHKFLRSDGKWEVVTKDEIKNEDFVMNHESVILNCTTEVVYEE